MGYVPQDPQTWDAIGRVLAILGGFPSLIALVSSLTLLIYVFKYMIPQRDLREQADRQLYVGLLEQNNLRCENARKEADEHAEVARRESEQRFIASLTARDARFGQMFDNMRADFLAHLKRINSKRGK